MPLYYFDIETTGVEPLLHQVITIQYVRLTDNLDKVGDLRIMKVWEYGNEKEMIKEFLEASSFFEGPFTFVPVGLNVLYDIMFLYERARLYGLVSKPLWKVLHEKPFIDLKHAALLANKCRFQDYSKLVDKFMKESKATGRDVPILYAAGEYDKIEEYIRSEFEAVLKFAKEAMELLAELSS
ncbi:MAG: hypothetical protein ACP5KA_04155 [Desulfurococcaceae archaeon]